MKKIIIPVILLMVWVQTKAQSVENIVVNILNQPVLETPALTALAIAKNFLDRPYVAATLEKTPEQLVCNLSEFDCYTLVENVTALTLTQYNPEKGFGSYLKFLQILRYREGVINGYPDRMHYFIDWAKQAVENGFLEDVGQEIGEPYQKKIDFMTRNRKLYPALATNDTFLSQISKAEQNLNKESFYYVPKEKFSSVEKMIEDGDIIALTSTINGLDVNHEGFAIRQNGKLYLLHASSEYNKVVISDETIGQYLNRIKKHSGVMVFRLKV